MTIVARVPRSDLTGSDATETSAVPSAPHHYTLRPYQPQAIAAALDGERIEHARIVFTLPTGSGKTIIVAHIIDRLLAGGGRARFLGIAGLGDTRDAPWRQAPLPPTGEQRALLRRHLVPMPPDLTKGQASDLIAALVARWTS